MNEMYHLGCKVGEVNSLTMLFGDPARCDILKKFLEEYQLVSQKRGFCLYNGISRDLRITFGSLGIGGPSWVIGLHELAECGSKVFVRVGTSGIISPNVRPGDIVLPQEAVSDECLSDYLIGKNIHLRPSTHLLECMKSSAAQSRLSCHAGLVHSKDFLYMEDAQGYPQEEKIRGRMAKIRDIGVLVTEMECCALFAFGIARNYETAAVLAAINENQEISLKAQQDAVKIALEGLRIYQMRK